MKPILSLIIIVSLISVLGFSRKFKKSNMKKTIFNGIFCSFILFSSQIQAQHLLEALEGQSEFTSTKSATKSGTFKRNNCDNNGQGKEITFTSTQTHTYTSNISQEDADNNALRIAEELAQDEVNSKGQEYANTNAKCIWSAHTTISRKKTYTSSPMGKTCGNVEVDATVHIWAASDISYHQAVQNANYKGEQELSKYFSTYTPNFPCADKYICQDHYEEEYFTSNQTTSFSKQCPISTRNTGTSSSYTAQTDSGSGLRRENGSYIASCTSTFIVDYITNTYKTETNWHFLKKYKTQKCKYNNTPSKKYETNYLGTKYDDSHFLIFN